MTGLTEQAVEAADPALIARLTEIVGQAHVTTDRAACVLFSQDLFPEEDAPCAVAVVSPETPEAVGRVVSAATAMGAAVAPRGGGMSYTGGYRPDGNKTIILDLRRLNGVRSVEAEDHYAVVEAGCTWERLQEALAGTGLRSQLRGPISGGVSTVGGALSQGVPGSMDGVLGLEVVGADGTAFWTGTAGAQKRSAFYRYFGPDLTGLFLGDCGAFGVKTAASLRLVPVPEGVAHASFAFETMSDIADTMAQIAGLDLGGRIFALDPLKNKTSTKVGVKDGVDTLKKVATSGKLGRGLKDAARIALAGQNAFDEVKWSLHMTFEGATQRAADDTLGLACSVCETRGRQIEPSIPVAMHAKPFSIRGFLGLKGERWAPLHGMFPLSSTGTVVKATEQFFEARVEALTAHKIVHSFMMSANDPFFLIEPMFYWPDKLLDLHQDTLDPRRLAKLDDFADNPAARACVRETRIALRDLFYDLGGVSAQVGRFYPYHDSLKPETRAIVDTLKTTLDPNGIFNPGGLGVR